MATMNISLPDKMKEWVEAQVKTGQYANVSDFVRDLLRDKYYYEEKRQALLDRLEKSRQSGISTRSIDEIVADAKSRSQSK